MNYADIHLTSATSYTSSAPDCEHRNVWYFTVHFWIFKKKMKWCEDCKTALPDKKDLP